MHALLVIVAGGLPPSMHVDAPDYDYMIFNCTVMLHRETSERWGVLIQPRPTQRD